MVRRISYVEKQRRIVKLTASWSIYIYEDSKRIHKIMAYQWGRLSHLVWRSVYGVGITFSYADVSYSSS